jgi:tyrosine-protein phosphatase SIW14
MPPQCDCGPGVRRPSSHRSPFRLLSWKVVFRAGVIGVALFGAAIIARSDRGLPPQEGIANFGRVNNKLFRGAQPDEGGIKSLKRLGIGLIINLRMPGDVLKTEAPEALACGITYTNVPLRGLGRPRDEDIRKILELIEGSPAPVFVHCEHGCDRTGTIIACYRIRHEKWSSSAALEEAQRYGMSPLERGMKRFVEDFSRSQKGEAAAH